MPDDSVAENYPLPGPNYTPGSCFVGMKVQASTSLMQTAQLLENSSLIGANLFTLQKADYASIRTHGANPVVQGRVGQQEGLLAQNVTAALGSADPNAGAVVQMLEQQAQNNATPTLPAGRFRPGF